MNLPDHHISLQLSHDVTQICQPLKRLNIHYFNQVRFYKDGSVTSLVTDPKWHQHFLGKEFACQINMSTGVYLWEDILPPEALIDAESKFDIANAFEIVRHTKDYYDIFAFGSSKKKRTPMSFIFNHMESFQKFVRYFQEQSKNIFQQSDQSRVALPSAIRVSQLPEKKLLGISDRNLKHFYEEIKTAQLFRVFSQRELDCLYHTIRGKSAREVGEVLGLSQRTVESYITSAKLKFKCSTKGDLIDKYLKQYLT